MSLDERIHQLLSDHHELKYETAKSGWHGGQNVNKRETKAQWFFNISETHLLSQNQKEKLRKNYPQYISHDGNIMQINKQENRTQKANKEAVIDHFLDIIDNISTPDKVRIATSVPLSQKLKRHEDKKSQSKIKHQRQSKIDFE